VVHVHVGPITADSASAWIVFARGVLDNRTSTGAPDLPPEVMAGFVGFLDEWELIASTSDAFLWDTDVDTEQVEFLALALHRVASELNEAALRRGYALMPPESAPFYRAVVNGFLDAMAAESPTLAAYAEELRSSWPGLDGQEGTNSDSG
jgi:hypothetical protein